MRQLGRSFPCTSPASGRMLALVLVLPFVLLYTSWVYKVLWGRSTMDALKTNSDLY